jgi:hypothetical protein
MRIVIVVAFLAIGIMLLGSVSGTDTTCPMAPRQLVRRPTDETVEWDDEVAQWMGTFKGPYMIHAAAGGFRGIKSFFETFALYRAARVSAASTANCLSQFTIGDGPLGVTRGIWIAAVPFKDGTLILLDCEGLFDPRTPHHISQQLFSFVAGFATSLGLHTWRSIDSDLLSFLATQGTMARFASMREADQVGQPPILNIFIADGTLYAAGDITTELETVLERCGLSFKDTCQEIRNLFPERRAFAASRASECELTLIRQHPIVATITTSTSSSSSSSSSSVGPCPSSSSSSASALCEGCVVRPFLTSLGKIVDSILARVPIKTLGGSPIRDGLQLAKAAHAYWQAATTGVFSDSPVFNLGHFRSSFCLRMIEAADTTCLARDVVDATQDIDVREREAKSCVRLSVAQQVESFAKLADEWVETCNEQADAMVSAYYQEIREQKFEWMRGEWSACSGSCPGQRVAEVFCQRGDGLRVPDQHCSKELSSTKPSSTTEEGCSAWTFAWKTQPGVCNPGCPGRRTMTISCVRCDDVKQPTDAPCHSATAAGPKPEREEDCSNPLKSWEAGDYQTDCPGSCGSGTQKRDVKCMGCAKVAEMAQELSISDCNGLQKPDISRSCQLPACPTPPPPPPPPDKFWKKVRKFIKNGPF